MLQALKEAILFELFLLSPIIIYSAWRLGKGLAEDIADAGRAKKWW